MRGHWKEINVTGMQSSDEITKKKLVVGTHFCAMLLLLS
jgi:hypothetical protein